MLLHVDLKLQKLQKKMKNLKKKANLPFLKIRIGKTYRPGRFTPKTRELPIREFTKQTRHFVNEI